MSESLRDPQLEPADHCWTILQDHGPTNGGWGPAGVSILGGPAAPLVYTGSSEIAIAGLREWCRQLAQQTGKPTRLVRYSAREDVYVVGGAS